MQVAPIENPQLREAMRKDLIKALKVFEYSAIESVDAFKAFINKYKEYLPRNLLNMLKENKRTLILAVVAKSILKRPMLYKMHLKAQMCELGIEEGEIKL